MNWAVIWTTAYNISAVFSHHSADGKMTHFVHYTGTYTVNPDCTVTETDKDETGVVSHYDEFLTPNGSLLTFVETDPGFVSAGVLSRGTDK